MPKSLSLALYLAAQARRDRAANRDVASSSLTEEQKAREAERVGVISKPRPKGPLIWFHTGQDPRATAVREFATRLLSERDELSILLTTSAEDRDASTPSLTSQFAPDETLAAVRRFIGHWKPDMAVWTEPDFRPALIAETAKRRIPLVLVDANTARPDTQNWRWWRGMSGSFLSDFQKVLTGNSASATTLRKLGAEPDALEVRGFLEEGTPALPCIEADRTAMAREMDGRPIWLAAHVSAAERGTVVATHRQVERRAHRLLLVIVPETPSDGLAWTRELAAEGFSVALRSAGQDPRTETQIYMADTEGEMGLWYRLAPISFLGQSLEDKGGINPFEAAALGSAILHGPHVGAHRQRYARLSKAKAALMVSDEDALGSAVEALLSPDIAAGMAHAAWEVCSSGAEVTDRVIDLVLTTLDSKETA